MDWWAHCEAAGLPFGAVLQEPAEDRTEDGEDRWIQRLDDERQDGRLTDGQLWGFGDGSRDPRVESVGAGTIFFLPESGPDSEWNLQAPGFAPSP